MLLTQEFLRNGGTLQDLKDRYGIAARIDETEGLVCLNYSMIESPMGEPIVQECRQLILSLKDYSVVSFGLLKFFNYGEGHCPSAFNWDNFDTYEKLDGSLIAFYHWNGKWHCATRSVPGGYSTVDDSGLSFKDLVLMALKDMGTSWDEVTSHFEPGYTYVAELTCPENQVVVAHKGRKLTLLAIRSLAAPFFKESNIYTWASWHPGFPLPLVTLHEGFSLEAVKEFVQTRNPLEHEGFVLVDANFNRIKLKSDSYCLMAHQRDGLGKSNKARLELILSEKDDDVMSILPPYVQDKITLLKSKLVSLVSSIDRVYDEIKDTETQKDFAMLALKHRFSGVLFALRSGKVTTAIEWFKNASPKSTLEWLNMEEDDNVEA
jgi:hypothetical protein